MTGPLAGEPRERRRDLPMARRAGSWLVWWVLMMSFWVLIDDSISTDELLAGAGAAALAALLAELVTYQAATRFRMRIEWLVPALSLPGQVVRDTVVVYHACGGGWSTASSRPAHSSSCRLASETTRQRA